MFFDFDPSDHLTSRSVNREISQLRFSQQLNAFFGRIWSLICSTANYSAKLLRNVALTKRRANEIVPRVRYPSDSNGPVQSLKGRVSSPSTPPTMQNQFKSFSSTAPVNLLSFSPSNKLVPSTNPQIDPNLPPHIAPESPQKICSSLHSSSCSQPAISVSSPNLTSIAYSPNFEYSVDFFDKYFSQRGFESNFKTILQTAQIYKNNKNISTPFNELSGEYTIDIEPSIRIEATFAEGMFKTFYFLDKEGAILEGYYENGELILTSIITPDRLTKFEGRFINGKVTDSQGKIFYNTNSPHNTDSLQDFNACYEGPIVDQLPHGKGIYKQEDESEERVYFKGNFTSAEYDSTKKSYTVVKQETISEIRELSFDHQQVLGYQSKIFSYDEECDDWTETNISINYEGSLQTYFKHGQGTLCSTYFQEREGKKIKITHQYVGEFEFDFIKAQSGEYTVIINDISSDTEIQGTVRFTSHGDEFESIILNTQEYFYEFDLIQSEHTLEDAMFLTGYGTRSDGKRGEFINGFHTDEYQYAEDDDDENDSLSFPKVRTDSQKLMPEIDVDGDYTDEDNEDENGTFSINSDATSGDYTSEEDLSSSEEITDNLFENEK